MRTFIRRSKSNSCHNQKRKGHDPAPPCRKGTGFWRSRVGLRFARVAQTRKGHDPAPPCRRGTGFWRSRGGLGFARVRQERKGLPTICRVFLKGCFPSAVELMVGVHVVG